MRDFFVGMMLLCLVSGCTKTPQTNTIGIELIEIPAGEFTMGSPAGEEGRISREEQVAVTLTKPFWLGKTAVTQSQFKKVMGTTPWKGKENVQIDKNGAASWITWDEAKMFCDELTELEQEAGNLPAGESYRLPTEAEWEYACRAGTKTAYSFGDDESQLSEYAWFHGNAAREEYPHKVGMKKPNPWGLHDMHGNVAEWCSDWYGEKLPGGTDPVGSQRGPGRVTRGGASGGHQSRCRSANRFYFETSLPDASLGFRVARSQSAQ